MTAAKAQQAAPKADPLYAYGQPVAKIKLPDAHEAQAVFTEWEERFPEAQVLVAPCGTKVGKTFGASLWLLGDALANPGHYCVWIAPTMYKCRIAYRYMKAMLPECEWIDCKDGALEIWFGNGSFIKFLHGRDAEITVEGEAIDAFVIDEAGKQKAQLWHSLLTTITQTEGHGIVTGTPRGRGWYFDLYRQALAGNRMLCHATLKTTDSPFIKAAAVERAKKLLPDSLFRQYYLAEFVSESGVYGDLSKVWREDLVVERSAFWLHPDVELRKQPVCIGVDLAKRRDYTVFLVIAADGETVGYLRMRQRPYQDQVRILGRFMNYFTGEDNEIRYDRTGVGDAVGETISAMVDSHDGDWTVTPVVFTNAGKQEMVSRVIYAVETGWWRCPRIPRVEAEFVNLEVSVTKSGLHSYAAPEGDHDDVHWAAALAICGAQAGIRMESQVDMIEAALSGKLLTKDDEEAPEQDEDDGLPDDLADLSDQDDDVLSDVGELM